MTRKKSALKKMGDFYKSTPLYKTSDKLKVTTKERSTANTKRAQNLLDNKRYNSGNRQSDQVEDRRMDSTVANHPGLTYPKTLGKGMLTTGATLKRNTAVNTVRKKAVSDPDVARKIGSYLKSRNMKAPATAFKKKVPTS